MYQVFLGYLPLPIAPSKIHRTMGGRNETIELVSGQEVNIIKPSGLTEVTFDFIIPHQAYPFASLAGQLANAVGGALGGLAFSAMEIAIKEYLEFLKTGKSAVVDFFSSDDPERVTKGEPFQFIVANLGDGFPSIKCNLTVTLESYEIIEDAETHGQDTLVSVHLKEYVPYYTKTLSNDGKITKTRGK